MLDHAAAVLPTDLIVIVVADRAYDVPAFIDCITARNWHWIVRCKANGSLRFRDRAGHEHALRDLVRQHLPGPGRCWKSRGQVFKALMQLHERGSHAFPALGEGRLQLRPQLLAFVRPLVPGLDHRLERRHRLLNLVAQN